ncbi:MAG: hypothetical protein RR415_11485 [Ruthenibacterium sp.]
MEQKRVFKMGVIERNMLLQSMYTIFVNEKKNGGDYTTVGNLILRIGNATNHKVYLSEDDYKLPFLRSKMHSPVDYARHPAVST